MLPANRRLGWLLLGCALAMTWATFAFGQARAQALLPTKALAIKGIALQAEIAATAAALEKGLMYRRSLPPDHGMLFVFNEPTFQCFWMKNTPLPLSIAFIDANGTINRITHMAPHTETAHCPPTEILYALEMEQGWFDRYQIKPGDVVDGLPGQ